MKRALKLSLALIFILITAAAIIAFGFIVPQQDAKMNAVTAHAPYPVSEAAKALHGDLYVADLHSDSLLWRRNPEKRWDRGHVDLPRLRDGGVDILWYNVSSVHHGAGHVLSVPRVALGHHVGGLEAGVGDLSD